MKHTLSLLLVSSAALASNDASSSKDQNPPPSIVPRLSLDSIKEKKNKETLVPRAQPITFKSSPTKGRSISNPRLRSDTVSLDSHTNPIIPPGLLSNTGMTPQIFPLDPPPKRPPRESYFPQIPKRTSKVILKPRDHYGQQNVSTTQTSQPLAQSTPVSQKKKFGHRRKRSLSASAAEDIAKDKQQAKEAIASYAWTKKKQTVPLIPSERARMRQLHCSSKRFAKHRGDLMTHAYSNANQKKESKSADAIMRSIYNLSPKLNLPEDIADPEKKWRKKRELAFGKRRLSNPETNQEQLEKLLKESEDDAKLTKQVAAIKKASEEITGAIGFLASELDAFTSGKLGESYGLIIKLAKDLHEREHRLAFLEKQVVYQSNRIEEMSLILKRLIQLQVANVEQELHDTDNEKVKKSKSMVSFPSIKNPLSPRYRSKTSASLSIVKSKK